MSGAQDRARSACGLGVDSNCGASAMQPSDQAKRMILTRPPEPCAPQASWLLCADGGDMRKRTIRGPESGRAHAAHNGNGVECMSNCVTTATNNRGRVRTSADHQRR